MRAGAPSARPGEYETFRAEAIALRRLGYYPNLTDTVRAFVPISVVWQACSRIWPEGRRNHAVLGSWTIDELDDLESADRRGAHPLVRVSVGEGVGWWVCYYAPARKDCTAGIWSVAPEHLPEHLRAR